MRRLYGVREAILTAALIAVGPFFLVTASVGVYDAMTTGLVTAAVLVSLRLLRNPRPYTALLLGAVLGAGALTKPTAWVAAFVLPFTLLLFDRSAPLARRRFLLWLAHALLALAVGYGLSCIARLTPLYDVPMKQPNQRAPSQALDRPAADPARQLATALGGPARLPHAPGPAARGARHGRRLAPSPCGGRHPRGVDGGRAGLGAPAAADRVPALLRDRRGAALGLRRDRRARGLGRDRRRLLGEPARAPLGRRRGRCAGGAPGGALRRPRARRSRACELSGPRPGAVRDGHERAGLGRPRGARDRAPRRPLSGARRHGQRLPVGARAAAQRRRRRGAASLRRVPERHARRARPRALVRQRRQRGDDRPLPASSSSAASPGATAAP